MAASPGYLLAYLVVSLLAIHYLSYSALFKRKEPVTFLVAAAALVVPVPVWTPMPLWALIVGTVVVAGWAITQELTDVLNSTTMASGTIVVLLIALWLAAVGLHDQTEWVPVTIAGSGAVFSIAIHEFLLVNHHFSKAQKRAGYYSN